MNISKEVRIGALFIVALVLFFIGFYFLKGASLFSNNNKYYCYFADVDGLQNSATVQIHGLSVGQVSKMELAPGRGVKVEMSMSRKIELPEGSVANLTSSDLLGGRIIEVALGRGPGVIPPRGELAPSAEPSAIDKVTAELTPRLRQLRNTIVIVDSALRGVNNLVGAQNQQAIAIAIQSIKATAQNLSTLSSALGSESGQIHSIVSNASSFTASLAKSNDTIRGILSNAAVASRQLANAPLERTIKDLQKATDQLQLMATQINSTDGTLGMLINSKELYNNLNGSVSSLRGLTEDLKANPKRYLNFSVFGSGGSASGKQKTKKKK
jgi:phospholipid/cholesterol/gamma-HCH transport system substrate-binding protein